MYSNEAEKINKKDIYDDFKLKKPFGVQGLYNISALAGLIECVDIQCKRERVSPRRRMCFSKFNSPIRHIVLQLKLNHEPSRLSGRQFAI